MKIISSQYNAIYTIHHKESTYIRQFSKFADIKIPDEIIWYESINGDALVVENDSIVQDLEDFFIQIME